MGGGVAECFIEAKQYLRHLGMGVGGVGAVQTLENAWWCFMMLDDIDYNDHILCIELLPHLLTLESLCDWKFNFGMLQHLSLKI